MIRPGKYNYNKPDIELYDYHSKRRYGIRFANGPTSLKVTSFVPGGSTIDIQAAGKKIGDFDEQDTWIGGRGVGRLANNPYGFWDSQYAWTQTPNHLLNGLLWEFANGLRNADFNLPSPTQSMGWRSLIGAGIRYRAVKFVAGATYNSAEIGGWIKKVGGPGTGTVELCSDSAGSPGTVRATITFTSTVDITDLISQLLIKAFSAYGLVSGTTYWVKFYGASGDNDANHWEIGGNIGGSNGYYYNGSSWVADSFSPYYRVTDASIKRRFMRFWLQGAMYLVDQKDDGVTASQLYINGNRGKATSATSTTLVDTNDGVFAAAPTTDRFAGALIKIVAGTGKGQVRTISTHTSHTYTVSVAFDITPDNTSEYVIYDTSWWTEVASAFTGVVVNTPVTGNGIVYFPMGESVNIREMHIDYAQASAHNFRDEASNKASILLKGFVQGSGPQIWRAVNTTVQLSRASVSPSGTALSWGTDLTFGLPKPAASVGENNYPMTGLLEKDGQVFAFKEDGPWVVTNDVPAPLNVGQVGTPDPANGKASIAHKQFIYYSWLHSVIRIEGSAHNDVGQDWKGEGLPQSYEGEHVDFDSYVSSLLAAVDAGVSGTSSVQLFDPILGVWHPFYTAYASGQRIRSVDVQPNYTSRTRAWIGVGGDEVFMKMPLKKASPLYDSGSRFVHETVVVSATHDMNASSGLLKFIKSVIITSRNLGRYKRIEVDYQTDDEIGTSTWHYRGATDSSPEGIIDMFLGSVKAFRYRLRMLNESNATTIDIQSIVPNGLARVPFRRVWTVQAAAGGITRGKKKIKADEFVSWLLDAANFPGRILMTSQFWVAHKKYILVNPPEIFTIRAAQQGIEEQSVIPIQLVEV